MAPKKQAPAEPANVGEAFEEPVAAVEETVALEHIPTKTTAVKTLNDVQALMLGDSDEALPFEKGDVALPFLRVLQSNSPQAKPKNAKYIDGGVAGAFFNSATNKVHDGDVGINVVPVFFNKQATLWTPRTDQGGGGFISEVPMNLAVEILKRTTKNEKGKDITPQDLRGPAGVINQDWGGKELVVSAMYYVLIHDSEGSIEPVAYPFTSTQMKKSRSWNAIIQNSRLPHPSGTGSYRAPMFGFTYHLTTIPEQNAKGDWMGVKIQQGTPLVKYIEGAPKEMFPGAADLYLAARDFRDAVAAGRVTVKAEEGYDEPPADAGGEPEKDDDLPF